MNYVKWSEWRSSSLDEFLGYHEKGAAIIKKLLTACTNVENVKEALERVVKIYSYETKILFILSREQLKYIDKLESVISKCCPKEYSEMRNEIMQTRSGIDDMIKADPEAGIYD